MAPPGACAHLGYQSPTPRYPSAGAAPTTQDRPPSTPAHSAGPLRRPRRPGSPRSTTRRSRPPRRHPPLDTPPTVRARAGAVLEVLTRIADERERPVVARDVAEHFVASRRQVHGGPRGGPGKDAVTGVSAAR